MGCCEGRPNHPYDPSKPVDKTGYQQMKPESPMQNQQTPMGPMGPMGYPNQMNPLAQYDPQQQYWMMNQQRGMQGGYPMGQPPMGYAQPPVVDQPAKTEPKKKTHSKKKGTGKKKDGGKKTTTKKTSSTDPPTSPTTPTVQTTSGTGVTQAAPVKQEQAQQTPPVDPAVDKKDKVTDPKTAAAATAVDNKPKPNFAALMKIAVAKKKAEEAAEQEKAEKDKAEKDAREKADKEAKDKLENEERERRERIEREDRERSERIAKLEREERERKERIEREDKERQDRYAKEEAERKSRMEKEENERKDRYEKEKLEMLKRQEDEEQRKRIEEALRQRLEEEAVAAKKRKEEEEELAKKRKQEEEEIRKKREEEEARKKREEEEIKKKREQDEIRRKQEAEDMRRKEEELRKRREEEAVRQQEKEDAERMAKEQRKREEEERKAKFQADLAAKLKKDPSPSSSPKVTPKTLDGGKASPPEDNDQDVDISKLADDGEDNQDASIIDDEDTEEDEPQPKKETKKEKEKVKTETLKPAQPKEERTVHRSVRRVPSGGDAMSFMDIMSDMSKAGEHKRRPSSGKSGNITSKDGKKVIFSSYSDGSVGAGFVKALIVYDTLKNVVKTRVYRVDNLRIVGDKGEIEVKVKISPEGAKKNKKKFKRPMRKGGSVIFNEESDFTGVYSDDLDEKVLEISVNDKSHRNGLIGEVKIPLYTIHQSTNISEEEMGEDNSKFSDEQAFYVIQPHRDLAEYSCSMQTGKNIKYPDGATQVEPGKYTLKDGQMKFTWNVAKGLLDRKLKDDCILRYDGTVVLPSEAILRRDGKLRDTDGKIVEPSWPCPQTPLPYEAVQEEDYSFWINNEISIIEPDDSDVALAFGIINLHMYRLGPEVVVRILEARGLPAKKPVFVMMDLSNDIEGSIKPKKPCLSLSVKEVTTKHLYKKSSLIPSTSPIKVSHSPAASPNRRGSSSQQTQSQLGVVPTPSVSSLQSTLGGSSLGPFKTKSQKAGKHGVFTFDDTITLKLQATLQGKYDCKDKCLTVTLWEKRAKVGPPENIGVLFLDVDLMPTSKDEAGDTWLAVQPPPPA